MTMPPRSTGSGRLAPGPFVLAAAAVYLAGAVSLGLLDGAVTARLGLAPFVLAQAILIALWLVLHRRRLRDAGAASGAAFAVAVLYALEAAALAVLVWLALPAGSDGVGPHAGILSLVAIIALLGQMGGSGADGMGAAIMMLAILAVPVLIALGFTLWAATRPQTTP